MIAAAQLSSPNPDAPAILQELVRRAEAAQASDVHLQMLGQRAEVSFRLDGILTPVGSLEPPIAERVFGRIKFLARLKTYQESLPQDGRIDRAEIGTQSDLRVATYPTVSGEKIVLRFFTGGAALELDQLGLPPGALAELNAFLRRTSGMLLLTGPAGSGKTTTIYACLRRLVQLDGRHIITIEDPVEQITPGIMQTEVNEAAGLTYATAARHLLRQDPQVLVLGEIRDDETAKLAVRAGLTGHLVISTLHAGSCSSVFERLMLMCGDEYSVWSTVGLVLNQRLVRRVCRSCNGAGCVSCLQTGYRGRAPLVEWLSISKEPTHAPISDAGGARLPMNQTVEQCDQWEPPLPDGEGGVTASQPSPSPTNRRTSPRAVPHPHPLTPNALSGLQPLGTFAESARALLESGVTNQAELSRILGR